MVEADASQCGFCTPGIAMALFAFLEGGEEPEVETIHDALAGNLCRCTGYRPIVDAARNAERLPAPARSVSVPEAGRDYGAGAKLFFAPRTLDELIALRVAHPDAPILAGGTDLGLLFAKERRAFDAIVSVARVEELRRLEVREDEIEIGAAVTYTRALPVLDGEYPGMGELIRRIGSRQIRNLGTIGGNIGNASPIGDTPPCLIALDATLVLRGPEGAREMPIEDFFLDYRKTDLRPDEVIEWVRVPRLADNEVFRTYKVSKRYDQDISSVIGAYRLTLADGRVTDARIAYGGMAATPKRARHAEGTLIGGAWDREAVESARQAMTDDFEPIDDFRAGGPLPDHGRRQSAGTPTSPDRRRGRADRGVRAVTASALKGGVHRAWRHDSAEKHVTGRAVYIDDMPTLPGTQEVWLATSRHPHARIRSIDCAKARAVPGVSAVVTAADIPGVNDVAPIFSGEPILADGVAEYVGHPVAAVAAADRDTARGAAALVAVEYEVLEPVLSIEEALERESYVAKPQTMKRGDADAAIAAAPHRVSGEAGCGGQDHFYLEGQVALAVPQEDADMLVYSSTQHPTEVQHGVAHTLGLPANAVTVEVRRMGGAFGGKESQATIVAAIAAVLARASGLPAKLRLARDDDMIVTGKRHDFLFRYEAGFDGTGRISGLDILFASRAGTLPTFRPR